jgi:nucleotide-binding universal stress UspA family protein
MRVLVAYDGSDAAKTACDLVAGGTWPPGTRADVVTAFHPALPLMVSAAEVLDSGTAQAAYDAEMAEAADVAAAGLARLGANVAGASRVVQGRPASVILEVLEEGSYDLLVAGSRGLGPLRSALLGSVSAELVDHAGCPVLVARGKAIDRVVLADDGSPSGSAATALLTRWPIFAHSQVCVASVAPSGQSASAAMGVSAALDQRGLEVATDVAGRAAEGLRRAGLEVTVDARRDDPAHGVLAAAADWHADLIVVGTRGHTGLQRLLLGSVARKVLQHAQCSVLVAHAARTASSAN